MTKLIVFTGLPSTGKTSLSKKLMREEGFARLSTDDMRLQFYEKNYGELKQEILGDEKEESVRNIIQKSKEELLSNGISVVVDSSTPDKKLRSKFLETSVENIKNYLVYLYSDIKILKRRQKNRGYNDKIIDIFLEEYWEDITGPYQKEEFIEIENNPPVTINRLYGKLIDSL